MVKFNDLQRSFMLHQQEYEQKAVEVLRSGWYILGNEVCAFEQEFSQALGADYFCAGVDNGLNAMVLGLRVLGVSTGDEVLVQSNAYMATVMAIIMNGATPIFVEPNEYYNMDAEKAAAKVTNKTKAILVTHLFGQATQMDEFVQLCEEKGIWLLEDCAQSHFAKYRDKMAGTFGIASFFSFYPTKNLGCFGDGGAVVSRDISLIEKIKMLRNYGSARKYEFEMIGYNSRLDEIQAGLLRVKLTHMHELNEEREKIAKRYLDEICNPMIVLPKIQTGATHIWHLFVVQAQDRADFREHLTKCGIATDVHYPIAPHLSEAMKPYGYKKGDFPIAEYYSEHVVSLPIFNGMTHEEVTAVIKAVNVYGE